MNTKSFDNIKKIHNKLDGRSKEMPNFNNIKLHIEGETFFVRDFLKGGKKQIELLSLHIQKIINKLNPGIEYEINLSREWVDYLLLLNEHAHNLSNPYSDIANYNLESISINLPDLKEVTSLLPLENLSNTIIGSSTENENPILNKTIYITAIGGTDSTFYKGLSSEEKHSLYHFLYPPDLVSIFEKYDAINFIPRAFAAKKDDFGIYTSNVESTIIKAYLAGIRNIGIIANPKTKEPITRYLQSKFSNLFDLEIIITAQPLLPIVREDYKSGELIISEKNGGYQGGHGHGLKYCFMDDSISRLIDSKNLEYFIFTNGDNNVAFNWGAEPFTTAIQYMNKLTKKPEFKHLRISFFLVWEFLRKGGFAFLLTEKTSGTVIPQIFEAELARDSGVDIDRLIYERGGYNTNVATGIIKKTKEHFIKLPMALKKKETGAYTDFMFEASLGTAITSHQDNYGCSFFDKNVSINVLGHSNALHQHWIHISTRKREDLFAYLSSLYKIKYYNVGLNNFPVIITDRDSTKKQPTLKGGFIDSNILNTSQFIEIFKDADFDVDDFFGTLCIDMPSEKGRPRGRIKFKGRIKLSGHGEIRAEIPSGECWVIRNKEFATENTKTITISDTDDISENLII